MDNDASILAWEKVGNATSSGVAQWDKMAGTLVDTTASGHSNLDLASSKYGNSAMLADMLTSNSPVINVQMGLEVLCDTIINFEKPKSFSDLIKQLGKAVEKFLIKLLNQVVSTLISALYNAVLKLRRMVVAKINAFLAEYVADACLAGLQEHLQDLANPKNALSIEEFTSSVNDLTADAKKNVNSLVEDIRSGMESTYECITGFSYEEAHNANEDAKIADEDAKYLARLELDSAMEAANASGDVEAAHAAQIAYDQEMALIDAAAVAREDEVAVLGENTMWATAFWKSKAERGMKMLTSILCARTAAYANSADFGLLEGIQNDIRGFLQGCLFQQALKTAKKANPGAFSTDVLNRLSNFSNDSNMLDAYNIAMAAGVDLGSAEYQIQLPSANSWVTDVYGDPYLFASETPINASQMAAFLTEGLPTSVEMMSGNISQDKLLKPWIADNYGQTDRATANAASNLNLLADLNQKIIAGVKSTGKSMTYNDASGSQISSSLVESGVDRATFEEDYLL